MPTARFVKTAAIMLLLGSACLLVIEFSAIGGDDLDNAALDFCDLELAFEDEFSDLSIADRKIGDKRWIAHTPWNGDFGDAVFADPGEDQPFRADGNRLVITASKQADGKWKSGLIASADGDGQGFRLQYGYFEAKMKLPDGPGVWPAFWLGSSETAQWPGASIEVDIIEYYGHAPSSFQSALHIWHKDPVRSDQTVKTVNVEAGSLTRDFRIYGAKVDPDFITYYLDQEPYWRVATPKEHKFPLILLANLALGSGHPIVDTPDPSRLEIDYIRAYRLRGPDKPGC